MALLNAVPAPIDDPIAQPRRPEYRPGQRDPQEGKITDAWSNWFGHQTNLLEKYPGRVASVNLLEQGGSISATDITDGTLTAGLYEIEYYLRVTTPEGLSTITVTLDWTDGGTVYTFNAVALNGDLVTYYQHGYPMLIAVDRNTAVRYAVATSALGTLRYALAIVLTEVKA